MQSQLQTTVLREKIVGRDENGKPSASVTYYWTISTGMRKRTTDRKERKNTTKSVYIQHKHIHTHIFAKTDSCKHRQGHGQGATSKQTTQMGNTKKDHLIAFKAKICLK